MARLSNIVFGLSLLPLLACGSSGNKKVADGPEGIDSGSGSGSGSAVTCAATPSYGAATQTDVDVSGDGIGSAEEMQYVGSLNADTLFDVLDIELYAGTTTFPDGLTAKTVAIAGDDLDYATCGACVLIFGDVDGDTGDIAQQYLATSGSITITDAGSAGSGSAGDDPEVTGTFTATLTNVQFDHVTIDSTTFESTKVDDGCSSSVSSATATGTYDVGSGSAAIVHFHGVHANGPAHSKAALRHRFQ